MKIAFYNTLNSIILIALGLWGYFDVQSPTALIPVGFGVILLLCSIGLKKENKIISHVAVLLTLVILVALVGMRLPKSLVSGGVGLVRVIGMILTSILSMVAFVLSFIKARR
ncbi:MAG: TMEM14 family protein [Flavobacteriales bacterium]|nr:TMEM14 family protein [Flavobacteriales bacterium]